MSNELSIFRGHVRSELDVTAVLEFFAENSNYLVFNQEHLTALENVLKFLETEDSKKCQKLMKHASIVRQLVSHIYKLGAVQLGLTYH